MSGKPYECVCGFKSTRATTFLRHVKESSSTSPGETHRLINDYSQASTNPLWYSSPEQARRGYGPATTTVPDREAAGEARLAAVLNDKELHPRDAARQTLQPEGPSAWRSPLLSGTGARASSAADEVIRERLHNKHSRKRTDSGSLGENRAAYKRHAAADGASAAPSEQGAQEAVPGVTRAAHLAPGARAPYNTRLRSQQQHEEADPLLYATPPRHESTIGSHRVSDRSTASGNGTDLGNDARRSSSGLFDTGELEAHEQLRQNQFSSPGCATGAHRSQRHTAVFDEAFEHHGASGGPEVHPAPMSDPDLPISYTAGLGPLQLAAPAPPCEHVTSPALDRWRAAVGAHSGGNSHEDVRTSFVPDGWDGESLAAWFEYVISWQNQHHSIQAMLVGSYLIAAARELFQLLAWAPMSSFAVLGLLAVSQHAIPAGMPALSHFLHSSGIADKSGAIVRPSQGGRVLAAGELRSHRIKDTWLGCPRLATDVGFALLQVLVNLADSYSQAWAAAEPSTSTAVVAQNGAQRKSRTGVATEVMRWVLALSPNELLKAGLLLAERGCSFSSISQTFTTLVLLWGVLVLSESAKLSQWNVAMVAYLSCFVAALFEQEHGELLEKLLVAVWSVLPLLFTHYYGSLLSSVGVGTVVMWYARSSLVVVPRLTLAFTTALYSLVWQLQRVHRNRKQHSE